MRDRNSEYIVCSAIHYDDGKEYVHQPRNIKSGFVICGLRHQNCIMTAVVLTEIVGEAKRKERLMIIDDTQGFVTNKNRFVGRIEAMQIAIRENQVREEDLHNPRIGLFSEDLY